MSYQWQVRSGAGFVNIAGAVGLTFVPQQAQVGLELRLMASFTDLGGVRAFGVFRHHRAGRRQRDRHQRAPIP